MVEPIGSRNSGVYGLWLSSDRDCNIAAGGISLYRRPLNEIEVRAKIAEGFQTVRGRPLLRVGAAK